jgi:ComF family protein
VGGSLSVLPPVEHAPALAPAPGSSPAWRDWLIALADLLFPPFCPVCRARLAAGRRDPLCGPCWVRLERITGPVCRLCGLPLPRFAAPRAEIPAGAGPLCGACRLARPGFSAARSAARYGDVVREAIHAFKFGGRRALAAPLGDLLAGTDARSLDGGPVEVLVPVPLHPRRRRERGFNQAELLAARLGRAWGLPVATGVLIRTAATQPQTALTAAARRHNVRGAFAARRPADIRGRRVLLVDDIMTTGATAGECATCLAGAGAAAVGVVTVARVL